EGCGGEHVERQLRLIEYGAAQLRRVDLEDARRRSRLAALRIAPAEEHRDFGEGLGGGEDRDDDLLAVLAKAVELGPALDHAEETVGRIALFEELLAARVGFRRAIAG